MPSRPTKSTARPTPPPPAPTAKPPSSAPHVDGFSSPPPPPPPTLVVYEETPRVAELEAKLLAKDKLIAELVAFLRESAKGNFSYTRANDLISKSLTS